jgi:hypothetical protein
MSTAQWRKPSPEPTTPYSENGWVDAGQVALYLGADREWVYRLARELDGRKLGSGPKAPWRFKLALVDAALERFTCTDSRGSEAELEPMAKPIRRHRQRVSLGTDVQLLPIRGEKAL